MPSYFTFSSVGAADGAAVEEKELGGIVAGLVVDVHVRGEVRRLAVVDPPLVLAPSSLLRQEDGGIVCSFVRLFVYSFVRLFVYSFVRLFVCSFVRLFVCPFVRLFVYSFQRLTVAPISVIYYLLSAIYYLPRHERPHP